MEAEFQSPEKGGRKVKPVDFESFA